MIVRITAKTTSENGGRIKGEVQEVRAVAVLDNGDCWMVVKKKNWEIMVSKEAFNVEVV